MNKRDRVAALIEARAARKRKDIERWCATPQVGIVAKFLDAELLEGACAPSRALRRSWVADKTESVAP